MVQPGGEILKLGDFSQVKVMIFVSDKDLSAIRLGQSAQVTLDAFKNEPLSGRVTRITPAADPIARQLPVEITIPNSNGQIGSGLRAEVSFEQTIAPRVIVPETALQEEEGEQGSPGARQQGSRGTQEQGNNPKSRALLKLGGDFPAEPNGYASLTRPNIQNSKSSEGTVFILTGQGADARVQARRVQLGDRANGKVEIISGLKPGERFVAKSSKPLKNGAPVRLSVLSEQ